MLKNVSILKKLIISHGLLLLIFLVMSFMVFFVTNSRNFDGLRINLLGRQRMLTQKMTKETLLFIVDKIEKEEVAKTIEVFERSLYALSRGGDAPKG